jgi:DNA-binding transcriptional regulator YiaG
MDKMYKSEPLMVIHEMAQDLYEIGAIDEARMREYDADCLLPASLPRKNTEAIMPTLRPRYTPVPAGESA